MGNKNYKKSERRQGVIQRLLGKKEEGTLTDENQETLRNTMNNQIVESNLNGASTAETGDEDFSNYDD